MHSFQTEDNLVKIRPQCFYSAVMENLKLDYSGNGMLLGLNPFQVISGYFVALLLLCHKGPRFRPECTAQ